MTENLSLIAVQVGFIDSSSPELGQLLSVGARFETIAGTQSSLQANGEGVFDFFFWGGTRQGSSAHCLTSTGFLLPVNSQAENQMFYWSHHVDRRFGSMMYGFTELIGTTS